MFELNLEVISITGKLFSGKCHQVVAPCQDGDVGIMAGHEIMISSFRPGDIKILDESDNIIEQFDVVAGGYVEVRDNNNVVILLD